MDNPFCVAPPPGLMSLPIRQRLPATEPPQASASDRVALPRRSHPNVGDFTEPPPSEFSSGYFDRIFNAPCMGCYSTRHRLRECGHIVRTEWPSQCGRNCFDISAALTDEALPFGVVPQGFACPTCLEELLDAKFKRKREQFDAEMAAIGIQLGSRLGTELFVLPGDDVEKINLHQLSFRERVWAKERELDKTSLIEKCGLRWCEAVPEDWLNNSYRADPPFMDIALDSDPEPDSIVNEAAIDLIMRSLGPPPPMPSYAEMLKERNAQVMQLAAQQVQAREMIEKEEW